MKIPRVVDSRLGYLSAALFMLVSVAVPSLVMGSASAAVLTSRSIAMSDARPSTAGVTYEVKFTTSTDPGSVVIDFCDSTTGPIVEDACTAPASMDLTSASTSDASATVSDLSNGYDLDYVSASGLVSGANTIHITSVTNPSTTGTFYARILTYSDSGHSGYTDATDVGSPVDSGGVALSTSTPINVSAAVRETMTFCVFGEAIDDGCTTATAPPNLTLGSGSPAALDPGTPSTGDVYSQVSTNADGGASIKMKTNNSCGGLMRAGAAGCDIPPVGTSTNIIDGTAAMFGMRVSAASADIGTVTKATNYGNATNYGMNYVAGNATGVGSTYGDEIYNTTSDPISNGNATLTFKANATSVTPAGRYQAILNLIATGTF
jgi:hypothetical protein